MEPDEPELHTYTARIEFTDVRVVTIEAENDEEAERKFDAGEWASEDTVDFYSNKVLSPLKRAE